MSTCTKWVDRIVITCKNWAQEIDYKCTEWADEGSSQCSSWADEGSNECSRWANDFLHLFSLDTARTDTPARLPAVADSGFDCEDDDEDGTEEALMSTRSELIAARNVGRYKDRSIEDMKVVPTQRGFNFIALLKILQTAKYPERKLWIENFKNIKTGIDASLFMTEAKLALRHGIDFNKIKYESARFKRNK